MAAAEEYRVVFWSPPTGDEVRTAFSNIEEKDSVFGDPFRVDSYEIEKQTTLLSTSGHSSSGNSSGSDDWMEPVAYALNSTALLTRDHRNVLDAFRLLQKDPNVQKMVMSLSCDKVVWDAIMKNEVVQDFRRSFQDDLDEDVPSLADPAPCARCLPSAPRPCFFRAVRASSLLFRASQQAVRASVERAEPSARRLRAVRASTIVRR
ncbi:hypothetical protein GUJ93_ZPchr0076g18686 [Zizania palustris]|uniref:Uncharacterized protein n=1 Tax=Zizania palustris TaxID=103762 RepID=A0A8J5UVG6_ZIZPA|nr:hypothetical protein GUJ93_ZPchr0076g18686 [Zizania palustris]